MNNFIDVVLPPFLLLVLVAGLLLVAGWRTAGKLRLWAAERRKIDGVRTALSEARDIMASLVADPGLSQDTRDRALASYEALTKTLSKENSSP